MSTLNPESLIPCATFQGSVIQGSAARPLQAASILPISVSCQAKPAASSILATKAVYPDSNRAAMTASAQGAAEPPVPVPCPASCG